MEIVEPGGTKMKRVGLITESYLIIYIWTLYNIGIVITFQNICGSHGGSTIAAHVVSFRQITQLNNTISSSVSTSCSY